MKLTVSSDVPINKIYLKDLAYNKIHISQDTNIDIPDGWYELCIEHCGQNIEIQDIAINDASIEHIIYTGYFTDSNGIIHQPATCLWDEGGIFSIWINTEIGVLYQRTFDAIRNGDYGTNLFDKYILTVDRPLEIDQSWDNRLKSFFGHGNGPYWWYNNDKYTPWQKITLPNFNTDRLIDELNDWLPHYRENNDKTWCIRQLKNGAADLPFVEPDNIPNNTIKTLIDSIGYRRLIDISVQTLKPGACIEIHRDDHYDRKAYPYMKGCKKFYWACQDSQGVHMKLGKSGLLPLEHPLLINTVEHTHAVIHQGNKTRTSILAYGEL